MNGSTSPKAYIFHGSGGAADGAYPLEYLRFISRETELEPHQLFDFFVGESVSSLFAAALTAPHPEDPDRALYTTEELAEVFYTNIGDFISQPGWLGRRRLISGGSYLDRSTMETRLPEIFHGATVGQSLKPLMITSHRLGSGREGTHIFFNPADSDVLSRTPESSVLIQSPNVPLDQATLAAMAHEVFMSSYTVKATGTTHVDMAAVSNISPEIMEIDACLKDGIDLAYAYFGCGNFVEDHTAEMILRRDKTALLSPTKLMAFQNSAAMSAKAAERSIIERVVSPENYHRFQMNSENKPKSAMLPENPIDTKKDTMALRQAAAEAFVDDNREMFTRFAERLGENHVLRTRVEPTAAFEFAANDDAPVAEKPSIFRPSTWRFGRAPQTSGEATQLEHSGSMA